MTSVVGIHELHQSFAMIHGRLHRLRQPTLIVVRQVKSVNDNFNIVGFIPVELHAKGDFFYFAIHPYFHEATLSDLFKKLAVMAFACSHNRRKKDDTFALVVFLY